MEALCCRGDGGGGDDGCSAAGMDGGSSERVFKRLHRMAIRRHTLRSSSWSRVECEVLRSLELCLGSLQARLWSIEARFCVPKLQLSSRRDP